MKQQAWQKRRIIFTESTLYFALIDDDYVRDHIPLVSLHIVHIIKNTTLTTLNTIPRKK